MAAKDKQKALEEIEAMPDEYIDIKTATEFMCTNEQTLRMTVRSGKVPFAYPMGNRIKIPRRAFVHYHRYGITQIVE